VSNEIFKVFILEDVPADLALTKRQVKLFTPSVLFSVAKNRTEFEEKIIDFQPDIVLSDYNLPDMNGLEALLYVREHLDGTPFVFITGILNDEERVAETILKGASGYLLKENIKKLPEILEQVITQNEKIMRQREADWERRRNNQLRLQKSIAHLRTVDFDQKTDIITALQSVADNLQ
jgi:CheY-like chemotaxis protein